MVIYAGKSNTLFSGVRLPIAMQFESIEIASEFLGGLRNIIPKARMIEETTKEGDVYYIFYVGSDDSENVLIVKDLVYNDE